MTMPTTETCFADEAKTLPRLEREADELERKLREVRASVVAMRAGHLAKEIAMNAAPSSPMAQPTDTPDERQEEGGGKQPAVMLAELPLQHPLRRKWRLFSDLPVPTGTTDSAYDDAIRDDFTQEGRLRLFGLLANGEPWECSIVYSSLMNDGGVSIGRDASSADVVLSDENISRCHARLELTNSGLVVTDENSTNGTGINDMLLTHYDRQAVLNDGDVLNIANIRLFVELI